MSFKIFSDVTVVSVISFDDKAVVIPGRGNFPVLAWGYFVTDSDQEVWTVAHYQGEWLSFRETSSQGAEEVSSWKMDRIKAWSPAQAAQTSARAEEIFQMLDNVSSAPTLSAYDQMVNDLRVEGMTAYRRYARLTHPDMEGGSHEKFLELQEACKEAGI